VACWGGPDEGGQSGPGAGACVHAGELGPNAPSAPAMNRAAAITAARDDAAFNKLIARLDEEDDDFDG
jgi:hypothetical protein